MKRNGTKKLGLAKETIRSLHPSALHRAGGAFGSGTCVGCSGDCVPYPSDYSACYCPASADCSTNAKCLSYYC